MASNSNSNLSTGGGILAFGFSLFGIITQFKAIVSNIGEHLFTLGIVFIICLVVYLKSYFGGNQIKESAVSESVAPESKTTESVSPRRRKKLLFFGTVLVIFFSILVASFVYLYNEPVYYIKAGKESYPSYAKAEKDLIAINRILKATSSDKAYVLSRSSRNNDVFISINRGIISEARAEAVYQNVSNALRGKYHVYRPLPGIPHPLKRVYYMQKFIFDYLF
jgi:hypothetical protein